LSLAVRQLTINDLAVAEEIVRAAYSMPPGQNTGLKRCLALQPDGWLLVESRDEPVALGGTMYYDFHPRRLLQHMRFGDPVQPRDRTKLYGQASFGLG
jgi:hypothetical protein